MRKLSCKKSSTMDRNHYNVVIFSYNLKTLSIPPEDSTIHAILAAL